MAKKVQVDFSGFNAEHYKGWSEADFVKDQLASVPDSYGDDKGKTAFLKSVYQKINPATKSDEKPVVKEAAKSSKVSE